MVGTPREFVREAGIFAAALQFGAKETWDDVRLEVDSVAKGKLNSTKRVNYGNLPAILTPQAPFRSLAPMEVIVQFPAVTSTRSHWATAPLLVLGQRAVGRALGAGRRVSPNPPLPGTLLHKKYLRNRGSCLWSVGPRDRLELDDESGSCFSDPVDGGDTEHTAGSVRAGRRGLLETEAGWPKAAYETERHPAIQQRTAVGARRREYLAAKPAYLASCWAKEVQNGVIDRFLVLRGE